MSTNVQTKLGEAGVDLQPAMPVHLDPALQQQYAASWPPDGARTLELTCLGQVHLHVGADAWGWDRVPWIATCCMAHVSYCYLCHLLCQVRHKFKAHMQSSRCRLCHGSCRWRP